jgi:16S rRNA processing protein RimM
MKPDLSTSSPPRKRGPRGDNSSLAVDSRLRGNDDVVGRAGQFAGPRVCLGVVGAPHGVRGAVRIKTFTDAPEAITSYGALEDESGERRFTLRVVGAAKGDGMVIATLSGIADRDRAEALRGLRLYLPRAALPATAEDEFYHADLVGLAAALADGTTLGTVIAVHDFGAGDMLEVARGGDRAQEGPSVLVPFTRAAVPVVDIGGGRVVLDPPEGLFDPPRRPKMREPHGGLT